jgi:formate dehydrogenase major subunit
MTNPFMDARNSDYILVCGANPASNHPISFKWINEARKKKDCKLVVFDPRLSQTAAAADIYCRFRSGTDIAYAGGMVKYVIDEIEAHPENFNMPYIKEYTSASYLVNPDFRGPGELDGLFSGYLGDHNETDIAKRKYDKSTWTFQMDENELPKMDKSLKDPNCVFQLLKKHFSRYTPKMVCDIIGAPEKDFLAACETYAKSGAKDKAGLLFWAISANQHTHGVQNITAYTILQLLLGNVGVSGGGMGCLRGVGAVGNSCDHALMPGLLPGYMNKATDTDTSLAKYLEHRTSKPISDEWHSFNLWKNLSKYWVSLFKHWYGDEATKENDFAFDYLPKVKPGTDYTWIGTMEAMEKGEVKGMLVWGQNVIAAGPNTNAEAKAMEKLDWLMIVDPWDISTANFWKLPGTDPAKVKTEVFQLPGPVPFEKDQMKTASHRMQQWSYKAADPPGDAKTDLWIVNKLMLRLRKLYNEEGGPNAKAITKVRWDYGDTEDGPDVEQIEKEINGHDLTTGKLLEGIAKLKDDGTTDSGLWIYCGMATESEGIKAKRRDPTPDPLNPAMYHNWGYYWPVGRAIVYNRCSVDLDGKSFNPDVITTEWRDGKWVCDVPDGGSPPMSQGGTKPFIMKRYGVARMFNWGLVDGPFPEHYEPWESAVHNALSSQEVDPCARIYRPEEYSDPARYPIFACSYRSGEHFNTGGMTRNLPFVAELMPEVYCEMPEELHSNQAFPAVYLQGQDSVSDRNPIELCQGWYSLWRTGQHPGILRL